MFTCNKFRVSLLKFVRRTDVPESVLFESIKVYDIPGRKKEGYLKNRTSNLGTNKFFDFLNVHPFFHIEVSLQFWLFWPMVHHAVCAASAMQCAQRAPCGARSEPNAVHAR